MNKTPPTDDAAADARAPAPEPSVLPQDDATAAAGPHQPGEPPAGGPLPPPAAGPGWIDPDDAPELTAEDFERGVWRDGERVITRAEGEAGFRADVAAANARRRAARLAGDAGALRPGIYAAGSANAAQLNGAIAAGLLVEVLTPAPAEASRFDRDAAGLYAVGLDGARVDCEGCALRVLRIYPAGSPSGR